MRTNIHVENELMRVHCHAGDLAGALAVLQVCAPPTIRTQAAHASAGKRHHLLDERSRRVNSTCTNSPQRCVL